MSTIRIKWSVFSGIRLPIKGRLESCYISCVELSHHLLALAYNTLAIHSSGWKVKRAYTYRTV